MHFITIISLKFLVVRTDFCIFSILVLPLSTCVENCWLIVVVAIHQRKIFTDDHVNVLVMSVRLCSPEALGYHCLVQRVLIRIEFLFQMSWKRHVSGFSALGVCS